MLDKVRENFHLNSYKTMMISRRGTWIILSPDLAEWFPSC